MKLRRLAILALVAFLGLVVVDVVLSVAVTALEGHPADRPSYTIAGSKARGAFVEAVAVEPAAVDWHGRRIAIGEAWIEQRTEFVCVVEIIPFVWEYRHYRPVAGYYLCLNLADGWDVMWDEPNPFFVQPGKGGSFGMVGTVVIWERLDSPAACPAKVLLTDNWKLEGSRELAIKRGGG